MKFKIKLKKNYGKYFKKDHVYTVVYVDIVDIKPIIPKETEINEDSPYIDKDDIEFLENKKSKKIYEEVITYLLIGDKITGKFKWVNLEDCEYFELP